MFSALTFRNYEQNSHLFLHESLQPSDNNILINCHPAIFIKITSDFRVFETQKFAIFIFDNKIKFYTIPFFDSFDTLWMFVRSNWFLKPVFY